MFDDFLELFKHPFHKFRLVGVKRGRRHESSDGRQYHDFIGRFVFEPPKQCLEAGLEGRERELLERIQKLESSESNCFSRTFTRRIFGKDGENTGMVSFRYVFDIVPENILGLKIDGKKGICLLDVRGYGME